MRDLAPTLAPAAALVLFHLGCADGANDRGGGADVTGAGSTTGAPYDATVCAKDTAGSSACLACCDTDLPGKSKEDYFTECLVDASCAACIPSCICNGSPEDAECMSCMQFPGGEVVTKCERNTCGYLGGDAAVQAACEARVACEYQCTCERCAGVDCVDLTIGTSDGQGSVFDCGSCGVTCTDNIYCIEGLCQCPPDLSSCGPH